MFGKHSSSPEKPVALPACQKKSGGPRQRAVAIPGRPAISKICRLREPGRRPLLETEGGGEGGFLEDLPEQPIGKQMQNFAATVLPSKKDRPAGRVAVAGELRGDCVCAPAVECSEFDGDS